MKLPKDIEETSDKLTQLIQRAEDDSGNYENLVVLMPTGMYWALKFNAGIMTNRNAPRADDLEALRRLLRPEFSSIIHDPDGVLFRGLDVVVSASFKRPAILNTATMVVYYEANNDDR